MLATMRANQKERVTTHPNIINPTEVADTDYNLYHVSRSPLSDVGYVYTGGCQIQLHDTQYVFVSAESGQDV